MKRAQKRNYLGEWRKFREFTQEELATLAKTSKATISRLESGDRGLSQRWLETLAPVLDAKPADLLAAPTGPHAPPAGLAVPLIDSIQAGRWTEVTDPYPPGDGKGWVPVQRRYGPRAFALTLEGPSMEPEYQEGDVIVVDPDVEARPGDDVVARIDGENAATFKRMRVKSYDGRGRPIVELVPLNPDWPVLTMKKGGRIVGPAVDLFRRLR